MENGTSIWSVRAALFELLSLSFRYPEDEELPRAVASGEWDAAAREIAEALGLEWPSVPGGEAAWHGEFSELHAALRVESTRLFVGAPEPEVSPYEGVWRSRTDGVQPLAFVNPYSMAVERFVGKCGFGQPDGMNEPLDSVWAELEFLQTVCMIEYGALEAPSCAQPTDDDWAATYRMFLEQHALAWMPHFAEEVKSKSRVPFYRAAADLLGAFLRSVA